MGIAYGSYGGNTDRMGEIRIAWGKWDVGDFLSISSYRVIVFAFAKSTSNFLHPCGRYVSKKSLSRRLSGVGFAILRTLENATHEGRIRIE